MARRKKRSQGQNIVRNMGLFWKRDLVRWRGKRGCPRRLAGRRHGAKRKGEVDFWQQTGVYALYADYHLIYVGQAGLSDRSCIGKRLKTHLTDDLAGRWNMFSWFGLQKVRASDNTVGKRTMRRASSRGQLANVLEGILIEVAEPPMNSQKGRFGSRVERYIQVDDSLNTRAETKERIERAFVELAKKVEKTERHLARAIRKVSR